MNRTHKVSSYKRYTPVELVLKRPDTYIGSVFPVSREERVLINDKGKYRFEIRQVTYPEGAIQLFREILLNASDNVQDSVDKGVEPGDIVVNVNRTTVSITNGGIVIPVKKSDDKEIDCYVPELVFGNLGTSSNYDETRGNKKVAGRNGLGGKCANIFSVRFSTSIGDLDNKLRYDQEWRNNMSWKGKPLITSYNGTPYVNVSYDIDFQRFQVTEYTDEAIAIFASHAADAAATCKIPVVFNGIRLDFKDMSTYARMMFGDADIVSHVQGKDRIPDLEIHLADTPYNGRIYSFVNGNETVQHGVHVDVSTEAFLRPLLTKINNGKLAKSLKGTRGLTMRDLSPHVSMIVSFRGNNPQFTGQMKGKLNHPKPKMSKVPQSKINQMMKWGAVERLRKVLEDKCRKKMSKSDGKKKKHVYQAGAEDANFAGHRTKYKDCTLIIVEGKSAMSYTVKLMGHLQGGRDYYGAFPLRGKPLNVMKNPEKMADNNEIIGLKKLLGLREGLDYTKQVNFKTLRYGRVSIMADADVDGKHIQGLALNLFECCYPSLLKIGYVQYIRTPIIRFTRNGQNFKFYTLGQYEQWMNQTGVRNVVPEYLKGLGSSEDAYVEDDARSPLVVYPTHDEKATEKLKLAFHPKLTNDRKWWVAKMIPSVDLNDIRQPISSFIDKELVEYAQYNLTRSIPSITDGLKVVQRKIISGSMLQWKAKVGSMRAPKMRVGELGPAISSSMGYHHGITSLEYAIIWMANDFIGSNNLRYFFPKGQVGCVAPDTPVLLWDGRRVEAKDISVGDELIGDDGQKRTVSLTVEGNDDMYEISQTFGDSYTVNSIHILTLIVPSHKKIFWKDSTKSWLMHYLDHRTNQVVSEEGTRDQLTAISSSIPSNNIIDIRLGDYLSLPDEQKSLLFGYKVTRSGEVSAMSKITVTYVGKGDYCGWAIDGNERFLLGDYTVTHNTRNMGGKDAAKARYSAVIPEWWWPLVFKKEDNPLLQRIVDDGKEREPTTLLPIVPLCLINGAEGIATGWSTYIPNHSVTDIVDWYIDRLSGRTPKEVLPWYRGFKGYVNVVEGEEICEPNISTSIYIEGEKTQFQDVVIPSDPTVDKEAKEGYDDTLKSDEVYCRKKMVTCGLFTHTGKKGKQESRTVITELPVGRYTHNYYVWLKKLVQEKKIKDFDNHSTAFDVHFIIKGLRNPSINSLRLARSYSMCNMVLLNYEGKPTKFDDVTQILEYFLRFRHHYYELRKQSIIGSLEKAISDLTIKSKFILAVVNETLLVFKKDENSEIYPAMDKMGFPRPLLRQVGLHKCTRNEIAKLEREITQLGEKLAKVRVKEVRKFWIEDLVTFRAAYVKKYGEDRA